MSALAVVAYVVAVAPSTSAILEDNPRRVSEYAAGERPCVAIDGANLREQPAADAKVVASLPLGDVVDIVARAGEMVAVGDRVDRFYEVTTSSKAHGFVFGNVLTNACTSADVDGDGGSDRVTVAWTSTYRARVRIAEQGAVVSVDVPAPAVSAHGRGGEARLFAVPALPAKKNAAVGVVVCRAEACVASLVVAEPGMAGVLLTSEVAANVDPAKTVRVDAATRTVALAADRAQLGAWPLVVCPRCGAPPTPWSKGGGRVTNAALTAWPSTDASLRDDHEYDGGCSVIGVVDDGPHAGKSVLRCNEPSAPCKGPVCHTDGEVFVEDDPRHFTRAKDGGASKLVDDKIKHAGVVVGGRVWLRAIGDGGVLFQRNGGSIAFSSTFSAGSAAHGDVKNARRADVLFVHRDRGRVRGDLAHAEWFWLDDGGELAVVDVDAKAPAGFNVALDRGCGIPEVMLAKSAHAGPLAGKELDDVVAFYASALDDFGGLQGTLDAKQVRAWLAESPPEAVVDPFDRLLVAVKPDPRLQRPCAIEPLLYLDDDTPVDATVSFGGALSVSYAEPALVDGAWRVHVEGAHAPLFWEGVSARSWPSRTVAVVPGGDVEPVLDRLAVDADLPERARVDFVRTWAKLLAPFAFVRLGVVERAVLDRLAPVEISPAPSTFARLYIVAEPQLHGLGGDDARAPPAPPRGTVAQGLHSGLRAAEWGGVIVESR